MHQRNENRTTIGFGAGSQSRTRPAARRLPDSEERSRIDAGLDRLAARDAAAAARLRALHDRRRQAEDQAVRRGTFTLLPPSSLVRARARRWRKGMDDLANLVWQSLSLIYKARTAGTPFSAEEIAHQHGLRTDQIKQALSVLNRRGLVGQARRHFAHDSRRDPFFTGPAWVGAANVHDLTENGASALGLERRG